MEAQSLINAGLAIAGFFGGWVLNRIIQKDEDTQLWLVQDIGGGNWNNPGSFEVVNEDWSHIAFQRKGNQGSAWVVEKRAPWQAEEPASPLPV